MLCHGSKDQHVNYTEELAADDFIPFVNEHTVLRNPILERRQNKPYSLDMKIGKKLWV